MSFEHHRRVHNAAQAARDFPDLFERLVPALHRGDPAADAAVLALARYAPEQREAAIESTLDGVGSEGPDELVRYVEEARTPPRWANSTRINRAGAVFRRGGVLGGLTLGLCSLVHGYAAPAGNKPLAFSGRLTEKADRRLAETGRFVTAVTESGGMGAHAAGFRSTLRVRLMHAQVRLLIEKSGRWQTEEWALPINQHDMLATVLLFSNVFLGGLRQLGFRLTQRELDDYQHLWRYVGWVMGVEPDLLPATFAEAERMGAFIHLTQGQPDDDSRALVRALIHGPQKKAPTAREQKAAEGRIEFAEGICRGLVGNELADALRLSRTRHRHWVPVLRKTMGSLEHLRERVPGLEGRIQQLGSRYWDFTVSQGLRGVPARFALPQKLSALERRVSADELRPQ